MDKNVSKILSGMSTAGLILAGSLPVMAASGWSQRSLETMAKSRTKGEKAKEKSAAPKDADDNAKRAPADKAKTQPAKSK